MSADRQPSRPCRDPVAVRLYEILVRVLPRSLRDPFGADVAETFHDGYLEARRRGRVAGWRLLVWSSGCLVACAAGEHWQQWRGGDDAVLTGGASRSSGGSNRTSKFGAPAPAGRGAAPGGASPRRRRNPDEMISTVIQDLRYAARTLAKKPAFALSAIVILAVGIGATTTIFSVVDTVVLRSLPYPDPGRLVLFTEGAHSFPDYNEWEIRLDAFSAITGVWDGRVDVTGDGPPEQIAAARVSRDFFEIFGATPLIGRFFTSDEYIGAPSVVVLGAGIWQRRWGSDESIVGETVTIDGQPLVVVGIADGGFQPPEVITGRTVDVWLPLYVEDPQYRDEMGLHVMSVAGRLADGATLEQAQEQIDAFTADRAVEWPNRYINRDGTLQVVPLVPLREGTVGGVSATLYLLLGAVGFMLLIACANVANLFLARGTERRREIALRGALGASRGRIAGQLLTEALAVSLIGGLGGVLLAYLGVALFTSLNPGDIPRIQMLAVDPRILGFAFFVSLATGVLFGMLPALQATRTDVNETIKEGAASMTAGRRGRRTRGALVVAEIALALVLLVGAGLLIRSLVEMIRVDPGFETEQIVDLSLLLGPTFTDAERVEFVNTLKERLSSLPGTRAAAAGWTLPFVHFGGSRCCWRTSIRDASQPEAEEPPVTMVHPVTANYFEMLGARLLFGRDFEPADDDAEPSVAVINERTAAEIFGTENPVGRTLVLGGDELTVIGVVGGIRHYGLDREIEMEAYVPYARFGGELPMMHVGVRSDADLGTLVPAIREAVWALQPDLPIDEIVTMRQRVANSVGALRFLSMVLGVFAGVALLLACGGIYGSMLYSVGQRQREMGIRLALGAAGGHVIRMVLGQGMLLTVLGLSFGVAGALGLSRFIESLIWGVEPTDTLTFIGVTAILAVTALAACFVPAFKAARADPLQTLRAE